MSPYRRMPTLAALALLLLFAALAVPRAGRGADPHGAAGSVEFSGTVELRAVDLSFKAPGRIEEIRVDEGHRIRRGEIVAVQDRAELISQKRKAECGVAHAESLAPQLENALEYQRRNRDAQVALARANLRAAESRLAESEAGNRAQQVESAKAALRRATIEHERIGRDLERAEALHRRGAVTVQSLDTLRSAFRAAAENLSQARENASLVEEGARSETLDQLRAGVEGARAQLLAAENLDLQAKRAELDLASLRLDIDARRADLALLEVRLNDATLCAPCDGVVLERRAETSEVLAAGAPVAVLADPGDCWVRGFIPEEDLGLVRPGDPVDLTSDSYPGRTFRGRVAFVSPEAEFTPKNVQTKRERVKLVYRVRVDVENGAGDLTLGMPVDARVAR